MDKAMKNNALISLLICNTMVVLSACNAQNISPTPTTAPTITPTSAFTPTPYPLGSAENPLQMGIIAVSDSAEQQSAVQALETQLSTDVSLSIKVVLFEKASDLLEKMQAGEIQAAWLPPLTYLYAHKLDYANSALMTNHYGVYSYSIQFLVNNNSGFTTYFDQDTLQNTADATTALPQLDGRRPCFIDFTSPSGYVVPMGILNAYNMVMQEPVITRTNTATVRALYIGGICDYGVTFATYGDPRTASEVLEQLPDAQKQVVVLWQTPPLIPNLNLSYHPDLSAQLRDSINNTLLNLVKDESGRQLLTSATQEDIQALKIGEDNLYTDFRAYFEASGLDLKDFIGK